MKTLHLVGEVFADPHIWGDSFQFLTLKLPSFLVNPKWPGKCIGFEGASPKAISLILRISNQAKNDKLFNNCGMGDSCCC